MLSIEARAAIVDVIYRYATTIDERQWTQFRTCWTDDAVTDYGDIGSWSSGDEITGFMERVHDRCTDTLHRISNPVVWEQDGKVLSRAYVDAVLFLDNGKAMHVIGRYEDEHRQIDGEWRIGSRRYKGSYARSGPVDEVL
jgi:3-phenylpropionate/cinnamic acid dioxygenase small subunit